MSVDSVLDGAFTELLAKARQRSLQENSPPLVMPSAILIIFDGAGQPLTVGMAGLCEIPFPCTILSCHLYSGVWNLTAGFQPVPVTATVDLRLSSQGAWVGGTLPLTGTTSPGLTASAEAVVSVANWSVTELQPGDLIPYALSSFTGTATFMTLALIVRRIDATGIGVFDLTDGAGDDFTDSSGDPFTIRG